ncbi:flagellin [Candidatus Latescibacterota bacterium]
MRASINSNPAFFRAISDFTAVDRDSNTRRARLSSGLRVNSGSDDGAHLSISEGMRAKLGGLTEGTRNAEKAVDLLRTAEGAMGEINSILIRMRELATEGTTDTLNDRNREALDAEFGQLKEYIDKIAKLASYNDQVLLSGFGNEVDDLVSTAVADSAGTGVRRVQLSSAAEGTYTFIDDGDDATITLGNGVTTQTVSIGVPLDNGSMAAGSTTMANFDQLGVEVFLAGEGVDGVDGSYTDGDLDGKTIVVGEGTGGMFQLGSDAVTADRIEYDIRDMTIAGSVLNISGLSVNTRNGSRLALAQIDEAVDRVARERGDVGAILNRLEYTLDFTAGAIEGVTAAEATVRDTDVARETTALARNQILAQMSTAAMTNSKVSNEIALSLLV